jgi:hypothetical protein
MGKQFVNPFILEVKISQDGGLTFESCTAHYGMSCEYGDLGRKGIDIELTPQQQDTIMSFIENTIVPVVISHEGM